MTKRKLNVGDVELAGVTVRRNGDVLRSGSLLGTIETYHESGNRRWAWYSCGGPWESGYRTRRSALRDLVTHEKARCGYCGAKYEDDHGACARCGGV